MKAVVVPPNEPLQLNGEVRLQRRVTTRQWGATKMHVRLVALVLAVLAPVAWCDAVGGEAAYRQAFYENTLESLTQVLSSSAKLAKSTPEERKAILAETASGLADCHMRAMVAYSPAIQNAAYSVVAAGGSYPEAKEAMNRAIATEGAAGGEREEAVKSMLDKSMMIAQACMRPIVEKVAQ